MTNALLGFSGFTALLATALGALIAVQSLSARVRRGRATWDGRERRQAPSRGWTGPERRRGPSDALSA